MKKKVLVVYYSQSGQLRDIVRNFAAPVEASGAAVDMIAVKPVHDFAFPWTGKRFFDAFPESVMGVPADIEPLAPPQSNYDLVVFGYQPWYLSPSIPATSVLKDPGFQALVKNAPVITIIGSRNMWITAQERVKKMLSDAGAKLVGNIALSDRNTNLVSAVTIVHWMMGGKKDSYLGIFPKPGVSDLDIAGAARFGQIAAKRLQSGQWDGLQEELVQAGAVEIKPNLMFIEERGSRIFSIWAGIIIRSKMRSALLVFFKYYLAGALFLLSPVLITIYTLFFRPFSGRKIAAKRKYYSGVN